MTRYELKLLSETEHLVRQAEEMVNDMEKSYIKLLRDSFPPEEATRRISKYLEKSNGRNA